jgi:hypothetical protein
LPSRRDPQVESRPNRCSHGDVPSVLSKQLVEQITEPSFEDMISASVTGTSFGQSSVTAHVIEARFARRRPRHAGARA